MWSKVSFLIRGVWKGKGEVFEVEIPSRQQILEVEGLSVFQVMIAWTLSILPGMRAEVILRLEIIGGFLEIWVVKGKISEVD